MRSALALVLLALLPLLPTLRATFVYDDTTIIRDNGWLRGWGALARVWGQPYWPSDGGIDVLGLYRPLHIVLLATIWNAGGGSARWFHVYALFLAAAVALTVWWLLRRGTTSTAALVGALWFASHPLHVEAIASVANTSELLVVLCIAALVKVLRIGPPPAAHVRAAWGRAALVGALAAAALLAKESGLLALPIAALTAWGWRDPSARPAPILGFVRANARAWSAAAVGVAAVVLARSVALGTPVAHASIAAQGLDGLSAGGRMLAMLSLWPRIAGMVAWPTSLSPYYGPTSFPQGRGLMAALSVLVTCAVTWGALALARRGDARPLVAVGWVLLTYLPASNLLTATGQILSDRTLFGVTVGVAFGLSWVVDRAPRRIRRVLVIVCAVVIAHGAFATLRYALAWTSHRSLWSRLVEASPAEHLGYKLLGIDARAHGDTARALPLLGRAFAMAPTDRQIRFEYGQVLYRTGRYARAATVLAPLMRSGEALSERSLVALYLDAVGRSSGPDAVVREALPLMHSASAGVAALFLGVAEEQRGHLTAADLAYRSGLASSQGDSVLLARRVALRARMPRN